MLVQDGDTLAMSVKQFTFITTCGKGKIVC